jgi:hypothetical protein
MMSMRMPEGRGISESPSVPREKLQGGLYFRVVFLRVPRGRICLQKVVQIDQRVRQTRLYRISCGFGIQGLRKVACSLVGSV